MGRKSLNNCVAFRRNALCSFHRSIGFHKTFRWNVGCVFILWLPIKCPYGTLSTFSMCRIELPNEQVSDTMGNDSSNVAKYIKKKDQPIRLVFLFGEIASALLAKLVCLLLNRLAMTSLRLFVIPFRHCEACHKTITRQRS